MKLLSIHETKAKQAHGRSVIKPIPALRLHGSDPSVRQREKLSLGLTKREIEMADDYDAPLPVSVLGAFVIE